MPPKLDLHGKRYGRLEVTGTSDNIGRDTAWLCRCDCGRRVVIKTTCLRSKGTKSCGCLQRERAMESATKHGKCGTRLYQCWADMKQRCSNPNNASYPNYGGRGIQVCDAWQEFEPFMEWALANGYEDRLELDRIDNDDGYEPGNCRWVTREQQALNRSDNRLLTHADKTKTLKEWAEETGIDYDALRGRLDRGWPVARALTE